MPRRTLDVTDLNLILRSLSDAMMSELARVSWNQSDDDRDAERAEIRDRYAETSSKVCTLLEGVPTAVA